MWYMLQIYSGIGILCKPSCFNHVWLCDPMDFSPPGSSVHGILQARILEWVAMPSSRGSSQPRDWNHISYVSCIDKWVLYHQASLIAQLVKNHMQCRRPQFNSWVRKIHWRRDRLPTAVFLGFPCGSAGKESACTAGELGLIPGLGRSPGEGKGYPLQYSGLENSMDFTVHGVRKSRTPLSSSHFHFLSAPPGKPVLL